MLGILVLIAFTSTLCEAGVVSYSYTPYAAYHHGPAASAAVTYSSHVPVYPQALFQQQHQSLILPTVRKAISYATAPVYARSLLASTPNLLQSPLEGASLVKTTTVGLTGASVAAPAVVAPAPITIAKSVSVPVLRQLQFEAAPRYDFSYGVHDAVTGDIKSQVETRDGGNVAGSYSVVDADGYKRTVTYTADDLNGFNAVVQREPIIAKLAAVASTPLLPAVAPVQQHLQYLPQLPVQQQPLTPQQPEYLPQQPIDSEVIEAPQQPDVQEPIPVEYPVQQPTPAEQPQLPQNPNFPPYPQYEVPSAASDQSPLQPENDDSDVIEARSVKDNTATSAITDSKVASNTNSKDA